jgi:hypothetical protein
MERESGKQTTEERGMRREQKTTEDIAAEYR